MRRVVAGGVGIAAALAWVLGSSDWRRSWSEFWTTARSQIAASDAGQRSRHDTDRRPGQRERDQCLSLSQTLRGTERRHGGQDEPKTATKLPPEKRVGSRRWMWGRRSTCGTDSSGNWSSGFEVAAVFTDGYRIRRLSDGQGFPDVFTFEDVQLERREQPLRGIRRIVPRPP